MKSVATRRSTNRHKIFLVLITSIAMFAAACGESSDTESTTATTSAPTTILTEPTVAAAIDDGAMEEGAMDDGAMDDDGGHTHDVTNAIELAADDTIPTLSVVLVDDPAGGWNIRLDTTNFAFAPEHVSTDHVDGEGHAHLYIDGHSHGRIYGQWTQVPTLAEGEHEIRIDLASNDHRLFTNEGTPISDAVSVTVVAGQDGGDSAGHDHDAATMDDGAMDDGAMDDGAMDDGAMDEVDADLALEITIVDGMINGVGQRVEVELGWVVEVTITADVDEEVHVHGYDEFVTLIAGETAILTFEANIPGVFEAELERRGQRITEFEVS